jgi:uncharacterized membrane protein
MTTRQGTERRASLPPTVVVGWLCLAWAVVFLPVVRTSGLRPLVVVPTTLVLPGYAVAGVAFGARGDDAPPLGPIERFVVSVALSAAVAMGVGTALAVTVGVSATAALAALTAVTLGCTALAEGRPDSAATIATLTEPGRAIRSLRTTLAIVRPTPRRAHGSLRRLRAALSERPTASERDGAAAVVVAGLVVLCGLAGTGAAAYLLVGHDAPGYTEFSVAPAAGPATDIPEDTSPASLDTRFERGDTLRIRLHNGRSGPADYEVVALAQRADPGGDVKVLASRTLERFDVELAAGETWHGHHRPAFPWSNGSVRVVYRLFRDDAETSVAAVHRWASVAPTDGEANGTEAIVKETDASTNGIARLRAGTVGGEHP